MKDGFTEAELADAKRSLLQARRIARAQDASLAGGLVQQAYLGRTWDYAAKVDAGIADATLERVNAVLRKYVDARRLRVVVRRRFREGAIGRTGARPSASRRHCRPRVARPVYHRGLKTHLSPRDLALTLAVVAVWGYTFVPIKVALTEVPPFTLAALRFFLAAVPMVFFIRPPPMPWREVVAYGFAIGVCQFGLLFLGSEARHAGGSLVARDPDAGVLHDRSRRRVLRRPLPPAQPGRRAIVAAAGMVVLAAYKVASGLTGTAIGFALVIGAAIAWAAGNIIAKRGAGTHGADMFALTVWSSLVPPLPLAALGFAFEGGTAIAGAVAGMSPLAWGCVLVMSYGATLFGFGSWNALLHRYPTALISPFALLIPVSGLASGALFLGESLAPVQLAGVALVFAGLVYNVYGLRLRALLARARKT